MRIVIVTLLALVAFAANSVLVRGARAQGQIGPAAFGAIRLFSGAMMLAALLAVQGGLGQILAQSSIASAAAVGWGIYTLRGQHSRAPTQATTANFLLATPVAVLIWWAAPQEAEMTGRGVALAVASGALASGIGYALWYSVLPALKPTQAAILQLTVPVIALLGGIIFLGEALTWVFSGAAALIIAGVLVALRA